MKFAKKRYIGIALKGMVLTSVLSACSGGGGGSDDNSAAAPAALTAPVAITSANASKVSAEAYYGVVDTREFGSNGLGSAGITAVVVSSNDSSFDLFKFTQQIISRLPGLNMQSGGDMVSAVSIPPETYACEDGGSLTISSEVADPQTVTAGDTIAVQLENCTDLSGVLNGQISLRFNSISKDSADEVVGFNAGLTMVEFSVTNAGETWTSNGDITTALRNLSDVEVEASLSGTSFIVTRGNKTSTLRDFSIVEIRNGATGAASTNTSGTIASAAIGGSATFETTEDFQRTGYENPYEGTALISGANGSSTQLVVLDSVNVRLDIDTDGDNSFEESIETTWAALELL